MAFSQFRAPAGAPVICDFRSTAVRFLRGIYSFGNPNYAPIADWDYAYALLAVRKSRRLRAESRTNQNPLTGSN
jgi:hypothetical protein